MVGELSWPVMQRRVPEAKELRFVETVVGGSEGPGRRSGCEREDAYTSYAKNARQQGTPVWRGRGRGPFQRRAADAAQQACLGLLPEGIVDSEWQDVGDIGSLGRQLGQCCARVKRA